MDIELTIELAERLEGQSAHLAKRLHAVGWTEDAITVQLATSGMRFMKSYAGIRGALSSLKSGDFESVTLDFPDIGTFEVRRIK